MGREEVSYHIRLIVTLNHINGNPYIWVQPCDRRQLPKHIKYCMFLLYYIVFALHTQCPIREFGLISLKSELQHSTLNSKNCVLEQILIYVNFQMAETCIASFQ